MMDKKIRRGLKEALDQDLGEKTFDLIGNSGAGKSPIKEFSKKYRHESDPLEKELHDAFLKHLNDNQGSLSASRIAFPTLDGSTPVSFVDEREEQIMINTIQWLGSSVGQGFLRDLGYVKKEQ